MSLIRKIISKFISIVLRVLSLITFIFIVLKKNRNQTVYICAYPLGDTCYALAYRSQLLKRNNCKFYFAEGCRYMIENCFSDVINNAEIIYYKKNSLLFKAITSAIFNPWQNHLFSYFNVIIIFPYSYYNTNQEVPYDYFTILKRNIFPYLPSNIRIEFPKVPKISINCINDFNTKKKRIVIINPFSNSMSVDEKYLWEYIANNLISRGYIVYTNVLKHQQEVKNTKRLECSIIELYNICNEIPLFVSIRSGIIDFTISSVCNKIVIWKTNNTIGGKSLKNICNLEAWCCNKVYSIYHEHNDETMHVFENYMQLIETQNENGFK